MNRATGWGDDDQPTLAACLDERLVFLSSLNGLAGQLLIARNLRAAIEQMPSTGRGGLQVAPGDALIQFMHAGIASDLAQPRFINGAAIKVEGFQIATDFSGDHGETWAGKLKPAIEFAPACSATLIDLPFHKRGL